ncbi:MAG: adenylate/guanylate cyclase domain-containing protein [Acidimicrobiia bacterium]
MNELPDGVVTFLFTDVEGSTRMWEKSPNLMMRALEQHDQVIDEAVAHNNGHSVKPRGEGDSRFVVFQTARDAVAATAEMQRQLAATEWVTPTQLRVRASLHSGTADLQLGDYYGSVVNRAARLRAIAHGGQTLISGATYELVRDHIPEGVTIRDMGAHGLKDLTRPEHVFQLDVDGLDSDFPELKSLDAVPNNLPQQLTEFVGREQELAEAKRLLGNMRLLTILAPGGAGKTRLAIQIAADSTGEYADGVFFVGLSDIDSSDDIIQSVVESLRLGLSSDEDLKSQLLKYLSNKRQLLVFDHFEHLTEGAPIISEILKAAPEIAVVATSRSKLNLSGETVLTLGGLETSWTTPDTALMTSGVNLFVEAARRAKPGFVLEQDDLEPLSQILRLTGGMPLGILLAAAWVDMLSAREIAAEIAKNLDFLETEMLDVPDQQRSVRAVFDYSWNLLDPAEREIFSSLSVFRGGFTRVAAEAVAGASLRNLATLANKSLLMANPDTGRYRVHELLRQYAEAEMRKDEPRNDVFLEAHAEFYSGLTEEAFRLLYKSDQPLLISTIEQDLDNIRMAWRHYLVTDNGVGSRRMIGGLWFVYEVRGWYPAAVLLFGEALDAFEENSDDESTKVTRSLAAALQGFFLAFQGQPEAGYVAASNAANTLRSASDPEALWLALQSVAMTLLYMRRWEDHNKMMDEGIALGDQKLDSPFWAAGLKSRRAFGALVTGDIDTAKRLLLEGLEVCQQLDEHYYMSWMLGHQARIAAREGRLDDAIEMFGRSVERAQDLGYLRGVQVSSVGLGEVNVAAGNLVEAEASFITSLAAAEQMSMIREMLGIVAKCAQVRAVMGLNLDAVEMLATVVAEPASSQQLFTDDIPIDQFATDTLSEIEKELDPGDYSAAYGRGSARSYGDLVKSVLAGANPEN